MSWLFPTCGCPQSRLALAETQRGTVEGAVQKQYSGSRSVCRARWLLRWLISYSLIAPSSCELLSSPSQRKGWIILQQLPLQHLGSARAGSASPGAAQRPQPPPGTGCSHHPAPGMHPRGLLDAGHRLGATNSCHSGPDSSCGSLQCGQPSALQPPALLRSQAVQYPRLK